MIAGATIIAGCATRAPHLPHAVGLHPACATAAVVGLQWDEPSARSGITGYAIARDGAPLVTIRQPYFADQTVRPATTYRYDITVLYGRDSEPATDPLWVTTAPTAPGAQAPYCSTPLIRSATWYWAEGYHAAEGSDLWPVTWGQDGEIYGFFGDGGGFGGDNSRGRASFGIARITGGPPPSAAQETNVYGGFEALYPSTLSGKSGSIIAVGSDFYAIGGIYRPSELAAHEGVPVAGVPAHPVSGVPPHVEIVYSKHNAHSWQDSAWTFTGPFCPLGFVNFGPANTGAPGHYVYLFGTSPSAETGRAPEGLTLDTFLARVPERRVLVRSAYQYFAGLDVRGKPTWSSDPRRMAAVFSDHNPSQPGCGSVCKMAATLGEAVYDEGLRRYIGVAQGDYAAQTSFYEAPELWGPWTTISYDNIDPATGEGGWGRLGTAAGQSLGVHIVNAWTSPDGLTLWMVYSSDGAAPAAAQFPPPGSMMDSFNLIRVRADR